MRAEPTPYRRFPAIDAAPRCRNCEAPLSASPSGICLKCGAENGPSLSVVKEYRCRKCGALLFRSPGGWGRIQAACAKRQCRTIQTVFLEAPAVDTPRPAPVPPKPSPARREREQRETRWKRLLSDPEDFMRVMEDRWRAAAVVRAKERAEMSVGLRWDVLSRDAFRCRYCGRSVDDGAVLHVDHRIPRSKGGPTTMENLITACLDCNLGKSDKDLTEP